MHLLTALRANQGRFLSGAEIARAKGLSRAAIWKQVEVLRARGYVIEARPRSGYRLVSIPDLPYEEEVQDGLQTAIFGQRLIYLPRVSSTNDEARSLGGKGWPEGTVIVAEYQMAGRGRQGREWHSPPGGLWFSLIIRPGLALSGLAPLTIAAAVAMARAVREQTRIQAAVKWPNDLVLNHRKLAGILAEASGELGRTDLVVLGIGLNVNQRSEDFPEPVRARATSLRMLLGHEVRRVPLLRAFLQTFERLYLSGREEGFRGALSEAAANSATLGRRVRVDRGGSILEGIALRLDPDGALVVRAASGLVRVLAGEVEEVGERE